MFSDTSITAPHASEAKSSKCLHHEYNMKMFHTVKNMSVREKKVVFKLVSSGDWNCDMLLPGFGVTIGEFVLFQTLSTNPATNTAMEARGDAMV